MGHAVIDFHKVDAASTDPVASRCPLSIGMKLGVDQCGRVGCVRTYKATRLARYLEPIFGVHVYILPTTRTTALNTCQGGGRHRWWCALSQAVGT